MFALAELRALTMPFANGRLGSDDTICFPLLNDRNQSVPAFQQKISKGSL
jgi:hypothetical protein